MSDPTRPRDGLVPGDVFDPVRLDGYTVDDLNDYLRAGRRPLDPSIELSAGCRLALDALARLHERTLELLEIESAAAPRPADGWIQGIMNRIAIEAHAGRDIPIAHPPAVGTLAMTEGAVRGMVRAAGDSVAEVIVGRCRLEGDVTVPGEPITVRIDITVRWGENLPRAAARARAAIHRRLLSHTELSIAAIDVNVQDVRFTVATPAEMLEDGQ